MIFGGTLFTLLLLLFPFVEDTAAAEVADTVPTGFEAMFNVVDTGRIAAGL